ncbi:MAG: hypothetical protein ACRDDY_17395 [Clostridium sp.]|uniref:hypothetical protein n=1 Tax=Clostridium sp. TaxID=1506 RepID=UPI003EE70E0F
MLLKLIFAILSLGAIFIILRQEFNIYTLKKDKNKTIIYSKPLIRSYIYRIIICYLSIMTILNLFSSNESTFRALSYMLWIIFIPLLYNSIKANYIFINGDYIEIYLDEKILISNIKNVSIETISTKNILMTISIKNDTDSYLHFSNEKDAKDVSEKLKSLAFISNIT